MTLPAFAFRAEPVSSKASGGKMTNAEFYDLVINGSAGLQRLALQRRRSFPLSIIATDADGAMLARADKACFAVGSLRELPPLLVN